jgi:para-aminobenzoate synthetase/4-amino-4-deoxychorismate lyase
MPPSLKPDPARGIFETMLVVRGAPVAAAAHLERLQASVEAVYGRGLPAESGRVAMDHAARLELGRLRLTAIPRPSASALDLEVEARELGNWPHFPARPLALLPQLVDGGLGCHKWADRAALPDAAPGEAPLLVDGDEVLEAAWANVFAVRRGTVFTPPLDGRILPGVTRATVLERARTCGLGVEERVITIAELTEAEEVFLTNSIRGMEIVSRVADVALERSPGPIAAALREDLRAHWNLVPKPSRA